MKAVQSARELWPEGVPLHSRSTPKNPLRELRYGAGYQGARNVRGSGGRDYNIS